MIRAHTIPTLLLPFLLGAVALPVAAVGQAPTPTGGHTGVLLVAHGGGPEWNAQVEEVARAVQLPGPVGVSFLMGPGAKAARFQDVADSLVHRGAEEIVVVPLLVSSHSGHYEQIRYLAGETDTLDAEMRHHLEMSGIERWTGATPMRVTTALDDAPEMAGLLEGRALALATHPDSQAVFLVGHGPNSAEDYAAWMVNLRRVAAQVKSEGRFPQVLVGLLRDDAPDAVRAEAVARIRELIELQSAATGRPVVVVPVLIATGRMTRETLPKDLAGLPIAYSGEALLPNPSLARWVEAQVTGQLTRR